MARLRELAGAWCFLTRVPLPQFETVGLAQSAWAFPLVGAVIGAATAGLLWLCAWAGLPPIVAAAITIAATLLITGGLHEDGAADTADGFGGGRTRERKLEIMRDSRIGSYGAMALLLALMTKAGALASLAHLPFLTLITAATIAGAVSRMWMVALLWSMEPARNDGLSAMVGGIGATAGLAAIAVTAVGGIAAAAILGGALIAPVAASGLAWALLRETARRQIGGQTGDVCGAMQVLAEIVILAAFSATLR